MIRFHLCLSIINNIHKYIHINNNLPTNKNYNASKLWDSNDVLNRRISQAAESPGQHAVQWIHNQCVMKPVITLTNTSCILWISSGHSVCESECPAMYVFIYLLDRLEKTDMSIHYLHIYWPKQHLHQTCLTKSLLDWIN